MIKHVKYFCLSIFFFCVLHVQAQYDFNELNLTQIGEGWFVEKIGIENTLLVSGSFYKIETKSKTTHKFFLSRGWSKGSISFRDQVYSNVDLMYDIEQDLILTNNPSQMNTYNQPIMINQSQVSWFSISDRLFKKMTKLEPFESGFYEVIYEEVSFQLYAKRTKEEVIQNDLVAFDIKNIVILRLEGNVIKVNKRGHWLRQFPEIKKVLKEYMVKMGIRNLDETDVGRLQGLSQYTAELMSNTK